MHNISGEPAFALSELVEAVASAPHRAGSPVFLATTTDCVSQYRRVGVNVPAAVTPVVSDGSARLQPSNKRLRNASSKQPRWTASEEEQLITLIKHYGSNGNWVHIAEALGTKRSAAAVQQHHEIMSGKRRPGKAKRQALLHADRSIESPFWSPDSATTVLRKNSWPAPLEASYQQPTNSMHRQMAEVVVDPEGGSSANTRVDAPIFSDIRSCGAHAFRDALAPQLKRRALAWDEPQIDPALGVGLIGISPTGVEMERCMLEQTAAPALIGGNYSEDDVPAVWQSYSISSGSEHENSDIMSDHATESDRSRGLDAGSCAPDAVCELDALNVVALHRPTLSYRHAKFTFDHASFLKGAVC